VAEVDGVAAPDAPGPRSSDLWAAVVGQDDAVAQLRAASDAPVHAYLLRGPSGSGTREAARAFAADLLAQDLDEAGADRVRHLVATEQHPALLVVDRGASASIPKEALQEVVRWSSSAPPEGERQVIVLVDLHLVTAQVPRLLKSIEEPPPGTFFVVLAEEITPELVTVASRCVVVDFPAVSQPAITARLVEEGVDAETAAAAAASAGGDLGRARLLARDDGLRARRQAWYDAPARLDGTGAVAAALVEELLGSIDEVLVPLQERQALEVAELDALDDELGERRAGPRKELEARHKREQRRIRTDELRSGLGAIVARYRDELREGGSAADFLAAADAVQSLADDLVFNPNEALQLRALFTQLPAAGASPPG
jgi:DNA polymerase-3 subunit delta'